MFTLSQRLKRNQDEQASSNAKRVSIRDKLLLKESQEIAQHLPSTCSILYDNENDLSQFTLAVKPTEGYWEGGTYKFTMNVPEEYNMVPPIVKCTTTIWHPNINEGGEVCLSLLRQHSVDGLGWSPIRRLYEVVWGINSLFTDLLNFEDPLNTDAADMFRNSKEQFRQKVKEYVTLYAKD